MAKIQKNNPNLCLFVYLLAMPLSMWDLGSLTRDGTWVPGIERRILNHWTSRVVPLATLMNKLYINYIKHYILSYCILYTDILRDLSFKKKYKCFTPRFVFLSAFHIWGGKLIISPTNQPWHQQQMLVGVGIVSEEDRKLNSWETSIYSSNPSEWQMYKRTEKGDQNSL